MGHNLNAKRAHNTRGVIVMPLRHGDRAHSGKQAEDVLCTVFKAPTVTKPLLQNLNGLSYTQDDIRDYQIKL